MDIQFVFGSTNELPDEQPLELFSRVLERNIKKRDYVALNSLPPNDMEEVSALLQYFGVYSAHHEMGINNMIDAGAVVKVIVQNDNSMPVLNVAVELPLDVLVDHAAINMEMAEAVAMVGTMVGLCFPALGGTNCPMHVIPGDNLDYMVWDLDLGGDFVWPDDLGSDEVNEKLLRLDVLLGYALPEPPLPTIMDYSAFPQDDWPDDKFVLTYRYQYVLNGNTIAMVARTYDGAIDNEHGYLVTAPDSTPWGRINHMTNIYSGGATYLTTEAPTGKTRRFAKLSGCVMWLYSRQQ